MTPDKEYRHWTRELQNADKRDKKRWKEKASKYYERYRGRTPKKNSFNIFWANTETLRPALYNSLPQPDVRRRFRDEDPLGRYAAEIMERSLSVSVDHYSFDCSAKADVLDALVVGRGLSRIRYIPSISEAPEEETESENEDEEETADEELEYECVCMDHVDWEDFRHGYGRSWNEVQWIGYRHKLNRSDAEKKFGEDAVRDIKYDVPKEEDNRNKEGDAPEYTTEFWEVWDKGTERVFFWNLGVKNLLFPLDNPKGEPPIDFEDFFPMPEPLRLIEDSSSLEPTPLLDLYKEQADELDRITMRINKIVEDMKVRGFYDSTIGDLANIMKSQDGDMVPVKDASKFMAMGSTLDKAIAWMPIEQLAKVLQGLYEARERCLQTIYELTGMSDIIRGQSNASETLGAQQLKANYGGQRIKRMQNEVQRYLRDQIRLMAEVIGNKFQQQTISLMTGVKLQTQQERQSMMMQAQQTQQQPDPELMQTPTWEDVMQVLRSDMMRQFRVDVETDSTVAAHIESDMTGLRDVLTGITQFWAGAGPAVQAGAVPIEAVKAITLAIARRAKLGLEVEDALDKIQPPQPQGQDQQAAQQMQAEQIKLDGQKKEFDLSVKSFQMDKEMAQKQMDMEKQQTKLSADAERQQVESVTKKAVDTIQSLILKHEAKVAGMVAKTSTGEEGESKPVDTEAVSQGHQALMKGIQDIVQAMMQSTSKPKTMQIMAPSGQTYRGTIQ